MYYCKDLNCAGMIEDAKAAIIETLTDGEYSDYYCDLHNHLFNEDYHYCYTSEAEDDLNAIGVFDAIGVIVKYEKDNFGEVIADFPTDFANPCEVANMLYYIVGEEVLYDLFDGCELWYEAWNNGEATEETNKALVQWLKENGRMED